MVNQEVRRWSKITLRTLHVVSVAGIGGGLAAPGAAGAVRAGAGVLAGLLVAVGGYRCADRGDRCPDQPRVADPGARAGDLSEADTAGLPVEIPGLGHRAADDNHYTFRGDFTCAQQAQVLLDLPS